MRLFQLRQPRAEGIRATFCQAFRTRNLCIAILGMCAEAMDHPSLLQGGEQASGVILGLCTSFVRGWHRPVATRSPVSEPVAAMFRFNIEAGVLLISFASA